MEFKHYLSWFSFPITFHRCSQDDGQCPCRPHLIGRQCDEVQPGFFCMPLDYYMYEAEHATGLAPTHQGLPVSAPGAEGTQVWEREHDILSAIQVGLSAQSCPFHPNQCSQAEKAHAVFRWGHILPLRKLLTRQSSHSPSHSPWTHTSNFASASLRREKV